MYWALCERFQKRFTTQHKIYWAIDVALHCTVLNTHTNTHTHSFAKDDVRDRARDLNYQIINHFTRETTKHRQTAANANSSKEKKNPKRKTKAKAKSETEGNEMPLDGAFPTLDYVASNSNWERAGEQDTAQTNEQAREWVWEFDSQITIDAVPVRKQINDSINGLLTTHRLIHLWRQWIQLMLPFLFSNFIKRSHQFFFSQIHSHACTASNVWEWN